MKCPNCGADASTKFCPYCGSEMPYAGPDTVINQTIINNYYQDSYDDVDSIEVRREHSKVSTKKKSMALIWCILLGLAGAHYFYVGKIGKGILYLFTCGLFGIGWIVDIIRIASGNFTDCQGLPLNASPMTHKEKSYWFIGLSVFGILGILSGIGSMNWEIILFYAVWTAIFGFLYFRNKGAEK